MALQPYSDLARSAAVAYENREDPRFDQEHLAERAAELAVAYRADHAKCREAEHWVAGTFDSEHYSEVTLALHRLHHTAPADLIGSDLLTQLYRLARVEAEVIDAQLLELAQQVAA